MDYTILRQALGPCIKDQIEQIESARTAIESAKPETAFDSRVVTALNNLFKTLEIAESFKRITRNILSSGDYFADTNVHHTSKAQRLKEILDDGSFLENNRQFNLGTLQTYMENILTKQLLEINIKIEENQRILHNLENARAAANSKPAQKARYAKYLFFENENVKYTMRYVHIIEILKLGKALVDKNIGSKVIPYSKLVGLNRRNVVKKVDEYRIQKNQPLNNVNAGRTNTGDKQFGIITRKENYLNIFFVDNIMYMDPVEAQDMGGFAKTFEGNYKTIEV